MTTEAPQMRAAWVDRYGAPTEVISIKTVPRPVCTDNKLLIRVQAASVHAGDFHIIRGTPKLVRLMFGGLRKPTHHIPGMDVAGVVEEVGKDVTDFAVGDHVMGDLSDCGFGAFAEYVCVPPTAVTKRPESVSLFQAAVVSVSAVPALQAVRDCARVKKGDKVLINGAGGGVGHFAIQIAKSMGAEVTAVCSKEKVELCKSLGADLVIDYKETDFVKGGVVYDAFIDMAAFRSPYEVLPIVKKGGVYVLVGGQEDRFFKIMMTGGWIGMTKGVKVKCLNTKVNKEDLEVVRDMLADGRMKAHVDRSFKLDEVAEAVKYVEETKAKGKIVVAIE